MKIHIDVFKCLSEIADQHNITQEKWADVSELKQPRIAELNRLYKQGSAKDSIGRAFTLEKCIKLYRGLKSILGVEVMKKKVLECAAKEPDPIKRIILLVLALDEGAESDILYVEQTVRMMIEKSKK